MQKESTILKYYDFWKATEVLTNLRHEKGIGGTYTEVTYGCKVKGKVVLV
jgi:hypothetical protein